MSNRTLFFLLLIAFRLNSQRKLFFNCRTRCGATIIIKSKPIYIPPGKVANIRSDDIDIIRIVLSRDNIKAFPKDTINDVFYIYDERVESERAEKSSSSSEEGEGG